MDNTAMTDGGARKKSGWLCRMIFLAVLLGVLSLPLCAAAQKALVYLDEEVHLEINEPYVRDARTYQRDAIVPEIRGCEHLLYKQTRDVSFYLFPVSVKPDTQPVLYLTLPKDAGITTAYLDGQPLSAQTPVEIDLTAQTELHLATKNTRQLTRLCFTNLPVLSFRTETVINKTLIGGALSLYDPDYLAHGLTAACTDYEVQIAYRGNSSMNYSKKRPYKFSLYKDGEKLDVPLIGLRKDSDWILDSAYNDASRMRNRVCMDVWDDMCKLPWNYTLSGAIDGDYVEVFVNGKYKGLYALNEKQDRKQLGLKKANEAHTVGAIFKTTVTFSENQFSPAGFHTLGKKLPGTDEVTKWYNVELEFPAQAYCSAATWDDFYDFTALVIQGDKETFAERINEYVYLENIADYYLFNAAMNLTDNMRKNMVFARYDDTDERFDGFFLVPWDMDASLGRAYSSNKNAAGKIAANKLFTRLLNENADFRTLVYTRWQTLKQNQLSTDAIMKHFETYYNEITLAGAAAREVEAHPKFTSYLEAAFSFNLNFEKELTYIRSFLDRHLAAIDAKIAQYAP